MAAVLDSGTIMVSVGGVVTHCLTSANFSMSAETVDTTCHNTAGDRSNRAGAKSRSVAFSGWYTDGDHATEKEPDDFVTLFDAQTVVTVRWGSMVSGKKYYEASAVLSDFSMEAGDTGSNISYSGTFTISGAVTAGTTV